MNKFKVLFFKIYGLKSGAANILKLELLSRGVDLIINRNCAVCKVNSTDALMIGTIKISDICWINLHIFHIEFSPNKRRTRIEFRFR